MLKRIFYIIFITMFLATTIYAADINDWGRGDGSAAVKGTESISDLEDVMANYIQNPLEKALAGHISGCTLTITDDEVITVSAGSVVTTSGGGVLRMRQNTSTITVDNTVSGNGGLDTGSVAANTWYYVYLDADADATTVTAILSTSDAAPQANCTYYRLIGCALTDATSDWLKAYYIGNGNTVTVMWDDWINEVSVVSAGAWSAAVDCSSSIPSISTLGIFGVRADDNTAGALVQIRPNGGGFNPGFNANVQAWSGVAFEGGDVTTVHLGGELTCATDSSQQIQYANDATDDDCDIYTKGFIYIR